MFGENAMRKKVGTVALFATALLLTGVLAWNAGATTFDRRYGEASRSQRLLGGKGRVPGRVALFSKRGDQNLFGVRGLSVRSLRARLAMQSTQETCEHRR